MAFNLKHRWLNENSFSWEEELYIYEEAIKAPDVNAEVAKEKKADGVKAPEKPLEPTVFKEKYEAAKAFLEKNVDKSDKKQETLHRLLLSTITEDFSKIENEYKSKVKELGKEDAEKQFKEKFDAEAEKLAHNVEHRVLEKMALNPNDFTDKNVEEKANSLRINLVNHYLEGQGYENSKEFAKYLLDSGALPASIDEKNFDKQMEEKLTPEVVNNAVKKLTGDLKKTITSTPVEKDYIKTILGTPAMTEVVGSTRFEKASEAIAAQFHIEFDKAGKPLFAVDTINDKVISAKELEAKIGELCKDALSSNDKIDTYLEKVIKPKTEKDQALFKKVTEGNTFLNLGKIDEMSDIKGNKDLQVLLYQVNTINRARADAEAELAKATESVKPTADVTPEMTATPAPDAKKAKEVASGKEAKTDNTAEAAVAKPKETALDFKGIKFEAIALSEKQSKALENYIKNDAKNAEEMDKAMPQGFTIEGENVSAKELINNPFINQLKIRLIQKLPDNILNELAEGKNPKIPKENLQNAAMDTFQDVLGSKGIEGMDDVEVGLIKKLNLGVGSFDDVFGEDSKIPEMISRLHKVEAGKEGKPMTIDGKEVTDIKGLKQFIPMEGLEGKFDSVINGKVEDLKDLNIAAKDISKFAEVIRLAKTADGKGGPEKAAEQGKDVKKMGTMESLTALLQLYGSLMAALKSGDYATLTDALKDFKEGKNPADSMKESRKNYTDALAKPDLPIDQLLSAYLEPRGEVADKLFVNEATPADKKESLGRYRAEAKPAILQALANGTGLTINSVTQVGDKKMVEAFDKDGQHVSIEFSGSGKGLKAEVKTYSAESKSTITKKDEKGVETTEEKITPSVKAKTGTNIIPEGEGLTLADIMKQVPNVIKNAAAPATEPPKAEEAKAKPEVTPAKSDEKEVAKK